MNQELHEIPVEDIVVNPEQPREVFGVESINELAASIQENDLLYPITVEGPHLAEDMGPKWLYTLVDGERRLRAVKQLGLAKIKALVNPPHLLDAEKRLTLAVVANLQRAALGPVEEARAYERMKNEFGMSNAKIAQRVGINVVQITNRLRLLELNPEIQQLINDGRLHKDDRLVKALLTIESDAERVELAKTLAARGASVKAGVDACERLITHNREVKISRDEVPSIRLAAVRAGNVNLPNYNVLTAAGKVPKWELVRECAVKVCDRCALRDQASSVICRDCGLVEFIVELVERTN